MPSVSSLRVALSDLRAGGVRAEEYLDIAKERLRAAQKHGADSIEASPFDDPRWWLITMEEVGEVARAFQEGTLEHLHEELVQTAAMFTAWAAATKEALLSLCRRDVKDLRQMEHLQRRPWLQPEQCTCRVGPGGPYYRCRRQACDGIGRACGGYCDSCFARRMSRPERPEIIVLCGSTKFSEAFSEAARRLGLEGKIVLSVACFGHSGDLPPEACIDGHPTKTRLDELHKRKIDMADRVLVLNVGGYIGSSTRSEIEYAEWFEKPIDYLEPDPVTDSVAVSEAVTREDIERSVDIVLARLTGSSVPPPHPEGR